MVLSLDASDRVWENASGASFYSILPVNYLSNVMQTDEAIVIILKL